VIPFSRDWYRMCRDASRLTIGVVMRKRSVARKRLFDEDPLRVALAALIQNQAAFVQNQTAFVAEMADRNREMAELKRQTDERFARIEQTLLYLTHMIEALPEAVRQKIGFNTES